MEKFTGQDDPGGGMYLNVWVVHSLSLNSPPIPSSPAPKQAALPEFNAEVAHGAPRLIPAPPLLLHSMLLSAARFPCPVATLNQAKPARPSPGSPALNSPPLAPSDRGRLSALKSPCCSASSAANSLHPPHTSCYGCQDQTCQGFYSTVSP